MERKFVKSVFYITVFSLLSRVFGLLRESFIAAQFGLNSLTDSYFLALSLITIITEGLTNLLKTTTIPILTDASNNSGCVAKNRCLTLVISLFSVIGLGLLFLTIIFAEEIVTFCAVGFLPEQVDKTAELLRIGSLSILISVIVGCFRGYLQSDNRFGESAISDIPHNIVIIAYLILLSSSFGLNGLMIASVVGVFSTFFIQIPIIKKMGFKFKKPIREDKHALRTIFKMAPGVLFSAVVSDINQLVDKSMSSTLSSGVISAFSYAGKIRSIVLGIISTAISTVYFPQLSKAYSEKDEKTFDQTIENGTILLLLFSVPSTVGVFVLSRLIVGVLFYRGSFDEEALKITTEILAFYILSIPALSIKPFLKNAFFAMKNSMIPMINVVLTVTINIGLNFALIRPLQHQGLAIATSVSAIITGILLLIEIKHKRKNLKMGKICLNFIKISIASTIMGIIIGFAYNYIESNYSIIGNTLSGFLSLIILVILGCGVYFFLVILLKVDEVNSIKEAALRRLRK